MLFKKKQAGFTLIEVMIVVAILGIIAAIALPSYSNFIRKSARAQATTLLSTIAQRQEVYFIANRTYGALNVTPAPLNYSAVTISVDKDGGLGAAGAGLYDVTMTVASATAFTITATAKNAQLADTNCRVFSLNNTGTQTAVNSLGVSTSDICW
jgi:type IV pilus assembly protein PilE